MGRFKKVVIGAILSICVLFTFLVITVVVCIALDVNPMRAFTKPLAYNKGKIEARSDLAQGRHAIRIYGLPMKESFKYQEILQKEYGIVVYFGGCVVNDELLEETRGYNEVMKAAIEAKHGNGFLGRVWERAKDEFEKENIKPDDKRISRSYK